MAKDFLNDKDISRNSPTAGMSALPCPSRVVASLGDPDLLTLFSCEISPEKSQTPANPCQQLAQNYDILEARLDLLCSGKSDPNSVFSLPKNKPLILTARFPDEGGHPAWSAQQLAKMLENHLDQVAQNKGFIDIGIKFLTDKNSLFRDIAKKAQSIGIALIASHHDFEKTPSLDELQSLTAQAEKFAPTIVKFAYKLNTWHDLARGLELLESCLETPISVMGMGSLGPVSRLLYAQFGSALTYGSIDSKPVASGQWNADLFQSLISRLDFFAAPPANSND